MQKSRLFIVLSSLKKRDIREIRKILRSPFHNQREDIVQLFDLLVKQIGREGQGFSKEKIFKKLFGSELYDDRKMRHTMSFLFKVIRDYLVLEEMAEEPLNRELYLTKALRKRGLDKEFNKTLSDVRQNHQKLALRNIDYHYYNYLLNLEQYEYEHKQQRAATNLQDLSDALTRFFISSILRQSCLQRAHQSVAGAQYEPGLLPHIFDFLNKHPFEDIPAISIYYHAYQAMAESNNPSHFHALKQAIIKSGNQFRQNELNDIYLLAINYCIKRSNQGEPQYLREVFDLYQNGLVQGVFIDNGHLSRWTYNNIVLAGLGLNEWTWVKGFLDEFKEKLHPRYQENTFRYNLAIYYYRQKKYPEAMELLRDVEIDGTLHNLDLRRMLLKMYFEQSEFNALESLLDSFKIFIYRHRDIGYHRDNYLNLIRFLKRLLKLNPSADVKKRQLRQEIMATSAVAEKDWLLEHVALS